MSLEAEIYPALAPLFPGSPPRVYAVTFPQSPGTPVVPACRFNFISTESVEDICGTDEPTANVRTQVDVLAATFDAARAKRLAVITAMQALTTPTRLAGGFDDYDPDLKLYRCSIDFLSYPSS